MTAIPDNARPTTPCDWMYEDEEPCGNTWGTACVEDLGTPICTCCSHVGDHATFRFLTGPEIAALIGQTPGEIIQGLMDEAEPQDVQWRTFSFTPPLTLHVRPDRMEAVGRIVGELASLLDLTSGVLLIPETIQPQENH